MNWQKIVKQLNLSKNKVYVHVLNIQIQHVSEKAAFVFLGFDLKSSSHSPSTCLYGTSSFFN